jgi:hypothetical protein
MAAAWPLSAAAALPAANGPGLKGRGVKPFPVPDIITGAIGTKVSGMLLSLS